MGIFFLLRIPPTPPPVQYIGTKQFDVCFGTLGIMYFGSTLMIENGMLTEVSVQNLIKWKFGSFIYR